MEVIELKNTVSEILTKKSFNGVVRLQYTPYRMETSRSVVQIIGQSKGKNFAIDKENEWVYEQLIKWVHGDTSFKCHDPKSNKREPKIIDGNLNKGLYVAGATGTGKSWAMEIISAYCEVDDVRVKLGREFFKLTFECIRTDAICDRYSEAGNILGYKNRRVICFQDLGTEPSESLYMGNRIPVMKQILESRGDRNDLITLITSNISMAETEDLYGERVRSRLSQMCNYLVLNGKDRRL